MPARHIVMVGPFALAPKATMRARALPLAETLVARGHRVTVLLPPWDDRARSGRRWCERGVEVRNIVLPKRLDTAGIVYRLRAAIAAAQPDVVHVFKPKGHGALAALTSPGHATLVVDSDDWEGPGGWNDVGGYSPAQRLLFAWQERDLPRRAGAVTVASRTLEERQWGFGLAPARVHYVPNGVTAWRHGDWCARAEGVPELRRALGLGAAPVVLLYTRFVEFAPARAARIFSEVRREIPDARLLVIGAGFLGEERALLAELRAAGLADAATHLPWVEPAELPAHLALGDVAILPYDDTPVNRAKCSVKTLDLMVSGRAVVADAVGQNRDYVEPGASGVLTPPECPEAFAPAVVALLRDGERRRCLGAAARARAWREFDWARLVARVEAAYDAALARRGGAPA
ncbi:MAG TPA: glycosyltransferase family 4 protein [Thermomicrobiales bacterium]|nr:glycosyltransferase family 4 protein [Thermomicrobiales bacterium]